MAGRDHVQGARRVAPFYAWLDRPESKHETEDQRLGVLVCEAFARSGERYGSPRVAVSWARTSMIGAGPDIHAVDA